MFCITVGSKSKRGREIKIKKLSEYIGVDITIR